MRQIKLFILVGVFASITPQKDQHVQLLRKKTTKRTVFRLNNSLTFYQFLEDADVVIDKSLFIKLLLEKFQLQGNVAITAPARWGKTYMLQMLRFFFSPVLNSEFEAIDPKLTPSYKYFNGGHLNGDDFQNATLISNHANIMDDYVARYPVIFFDISELLGWSSYETYRAKLLTMLANGIVEPHGATIDRLCDKAIDSAGLPVPYSKQFGYWCELYRSKKTNVADAKDPVDEMSFAETAIHLLRLFYRKSAFVLVDEYHKLLQEMYVPLNGVYAYDNGSIRQAVFNNFQTFISTIIKLSNQRVTDERTVSFVLLTGVLPIRLESVKYSSFVDPDVCHFYGGASENIAGDIFRLYQVSERKQTVCQNSYGGYRTRWSSNLSFYNSYSLLVAVTKGKYNYYWKNNGAFRYAITLMKNNQKIKSSLKQLASRQCLPYSGSLEPFTVDDLNTMADEMRKHLVDTSHQYFLEYLYHTGYVTIVTEDEYRRKYAVGFSDNLTEAGDGTRTCCVSPNLETTKQFSEAL